MATMENTMAVPQKLKIETPYDPAIPFQSISEGSEINISKTYLQTHVHCSIIYIDKI